MAFGTTVTVPTVSGSHSDFPAVFIVNGTRNDLPSDAYNSANQILNGGGNLRAYTDDTKTTRLAVEIVRFVTGASPDIEVWVKVPTFATSSAIYVEADDTETTQPAVGAAFGRNAVWSDYSLAVHMEGTTPVDSSGTLTSPSYIGTLTSVTGHPGGLAAVDFADQSNIDFGISADSASDLHLSAWVNPQTSNTQGDIIARRLGGSWNYEWRLESLDPSILIGSTSPNDPAAALATGTWKKLGLDVSGTTITFYRDGASTGTSSVSGSRETSDRTVTVGSFDTTNSGLSVLSELGEVRITERTLSADWESAEYDNQSSTTAFYTNDGWADGATGTNVSATTDSLLITEQAATVNAETAVQAGTDSLLIAEQTADVNLNKNISANTDALVLSPLAADVNLDRSISAGFDTLILTEFTATVTSDGADTNVLAGTVALSIAEQAATVNAETNVNANSDSLLIVEQAAQIGLSTNVSAGVDTLVLAEQPANVQLNLDVLTSAASLTLNTLSASIAATAAADVTIDGSASLVISTDFQSKTLYFNGSNYFTID